VKSAGENSNMAKKESASASTSLQMPEFSVGAPHALRRRLPALAKVWADRYRASGDFPAPVEVLVAPGTLVFTDSTADLSGRDGVRIYLVPELHDAIQQALDWADSETVRSAFGATIRDTCWGKLVLGVLYRRPDSVASLQTRIDSLLSCWDILAQLRYVDFDSTPVSLSDLVKSRFEGLLAMWLPQSSGDVRRDLQAAMAALKAADTDTRLNRAARRLAQLAAINKRIRAKDKLTDLNFLRSELAQLGPQQRETIEAGSSEALTFLIGTDRTLGKR
jgi:hypothetical protein